jgi:hypothetical protein
MSWQDVIRDVEAGGSNPLTPTTRCLQVGHLDVCAAKERGLLVTGGDRQPDDQHSYCHLTTWPPATLRCSQISRRRLTSSSSVSSRAFRGRARRPRTPPGSWHRHAGPSPTSGRRLDGAGASAPVPQPPRLHGVPRCQVVYTSQSRASIDFDVRHFAGARPLVRWDRSSGVTSPCAGAARAGAPYC